MPELLLVVGPIASGKSVVANALGDRIREAGRDVAVLDLDDVVESIGGFATLSSTRFNQAFTVLGQVVGAWLADGVDVIAHGPFFEPKAREAVLRHVPSETHVRQVLLMVEYEVEFQRVMGDPSRTLSKDPERLEKAHRRAMALIHELPASDWSFDTATTDVDELVDHLCKALICSGPNHD